MKKNLLKLVAALFCLLVVLDVTGGTLAQPEQRGGQDRFVGYHLVYQYLDYDEGFPVDQSQWTDYGTSYIRLDDLGQVELPRKVLVGQFDEGERRYIFPGLEGVNCFLAAWEDENGERYVDGYSGLADAHIKRGNEEDSLRGTVYYGPGAEGLYDDDKFGEYVWTAYPVYQMEDGRVYLENSEHSYGGAGGFTVSRREEYATQVNGKRTTQAIEVEFTLTQVERLVSATVKWFNGADQLLEEQVFTPEEIGKERTLTAPQGAVWAMVEDLDQEGNRTRSAYTLTEEKPGVHEMILLDDRGMGREAWLYLDLTE